MYKNLIKELNYADKKNKKINIKKMSDQYKLSIYTIFFIKYDLKKGNDYYKKLEKINIFKLHYKKDHESIQIRGINEIAKISLTSLTSVFYIDNYIDNFLEKSNIYKFWLSVMPKKTPKSLYNYKIEYPLSNYAYVDNEINKHGFYLSMNQYLYHGGEWKSKENELITQKPLSTTLNPIIAINNAQHNEKAYNANILDLFVLRVKNPYLKVFIFNDNDFSNLGREKEVLFKSGVKLKVNSIEELTNSITAYAHNHKKKQIKARIINIDIC